MHGERGLRREPVNQKTMHTPSSQQLTENTTSAHNRITNSSSIITTENREYQTKHKGQQQPQQYTSCLLPNLYQDKIRPRERSHASLHNRGCRRDYPPSLSSENIWNKSSPNPTHIDNTPSQHTEAHHRNLHWPQSPYPEEGSVKPLNPRYHKTKPPHPTEQQSKDEPKEKTNRTPDRTKRDQKTICNQTEHNSNHRTSQHLPYQGQNQKRLATSNRQRAGVHKKQENTRAAETAEKANEDRLQSPILPKDTKDTRPLPIPLRTATQDPETHPEEGDKTTKTVITDSTASQRAAAIVEKGKNKVDGQPIKTNDDPPNTTGLSHNATGAGA
jgi:hypothetical protein